MSSDVATPQPDDLPDEPIDLDPEIEPEPGADQDADDDSGPQPERDDTLINPKNS